MSKKYFLLSVLLSTFSIMGTTYANEYNKSRGSIPNKSNSSIKIDNGIYFCIGGIAGSAVNSVVRDKLNSKELNKSINDSNDWKDKYEKEYAEKEQLKEENKVLKEENEKIKEQFVNFKQKYGLDQNHSIDNLIECYNTGKTLDNLTDVIYGKGQPLEYLNDRLGHKFDGVIPSYSVFDDRNEYSPGSNCAAFKQILNNENILTNFHSLPAEFQELFLKVAIKYMAAIQAACNIVVYNSYVDNYIYLKKCRDIIDRK